MYLPVLILILVVALALILIIMVQNPKGGGLSSSFGGGANTIGGVQNTNTFLDKSTWTLVIVLFSLILFSNFLIERGNSNNPTLDNTLEGIEIKSEEKQKPELTTNTKEESSKQEENSTK